MIHSKLFKFAIFIKSIQIIYNLVEEIINTVIQFELYILFIPNAIFPYSSLEYYQNVDGKKIETIQFGKITNQIDFSDHIIDTLE
jgi:predicted thioredoxin/glutaredoxin